MAREVLTAIEASFEHNLGALDWMDAATKEQANIKLHKIDNKIGFPDKWRSYDALEIDRSSLFQNSLRPNVFANLWLRVAGGLAAYGDISTPTSLDPTRKVTGARGPTHNAAARFARDGRRSPE